VVHDASNYYLKLAAAFVRGRHGPDGPFALPDELRRKRLGNLSKDELVTIFACGLEAGLTLHKFKRRTELPRVRRVFGVLRSLAPKNLLDVGSGRGVFLWPLLEEFPELPVTAIDRDPGRARDLEAVRLGGIERLAAHEMDVTELAFDADSFDVTTLLEVLEHVPSVAKAVAETVRVTQRFIIVSAPSRPDDNPQHIHLLSEERLRELFAAAGVTRVNCDYVLGHVIAVASVQDELC
jgi:2-polyprenyl-3-methyl-5-hydroxy-6-metoxy-1,4-benzoquinol methylase